MTQEAAGPVGTKHLHQICLKRGSRVVLSAQQGYFGGLE